MSNDACIFKFDIEIIHSLSFLVFILCLSQLIERFHFFIKSHQNEFNQMIIKTNRATFLHDFK